MTAKPTYPVTFDLTTRRGRERSREIWTGAFVPDLTHEQIAQARAAGYEPDGDRFIGRDPRAMAQHELRAIQHFPMSPMQAIRAKCLDCCAGSADEVRKCVAMACPSWPYRMGKNPWRAPISDERRELLRQRSPFASRPHKTEDQNNESEGDHQD